MEARPGEPSPGELTGSVLALQRTAGNRAVTGLIGAGSPAVARAEADDGVKGAVRVMETLFGADFSDVALEESREASDIGAEAFTFGNRITFAPGRADVSSGDGRKLLAHELAHVIQQRAGRVPKARQGRGSEVLNLDAGLEAEAETAAAAAAAGNAVTVAGGSGRLPVALAEPPATQGFVPQVVLGAGREVGKGALKRLAAHGVAAGINA